ncbi:MAG: hypothetical protein ACQEWW_26230 [Bacillota bacterium]
MAKSEHIFSLNLDSQGETIGSLDMLDGDTGKTYSLEIWDGGNKDNLYICPLDPKVDIEERDVRYINEVFTPDVCQRIEDFYKSGEPDSLILHNDDWVLDRTEVIQDERFADWIKRAENGDRNFSEKEVSLYQEMTNNGYPSLNALEARTALKDNDISLDSAEKIISDYVKQVNEDKPLIQSKTDDQYREQYQLLSTEKEGETLKMKYLDRDDSGFRSKTFQYNQESGMVTEMDTAMVRGRDGMLEPESTFVDSINIKEMQSQVQTNTQTITEEKTITRVTQSMEMER